MINIVYFDQPMGASLIILWSNCPSQAEKRGERKKERNRQKTEKTVKRENTSKRTRIKKTVS